MTWGTENDPQRPPAHLLHVAPNLSPSFPVISLTPNKNMFFSHASLELDEKIDTTFMPVIFSMELEPAEL